MSKRNDKLLEPTMWSFATKGAAFVLFFSFDIFLARSLVENDLYGSWSYFFSILSIFLMISAFGINGSAKVFCAKHYPKKEIGPVILSALLLRVFFSLFFTGVLILLAGPLSKLLLRPYLNDLFLWSAPLVLAWGLNELAKSIFMGIHNIRSLFFITVAEHALRLAAAIGFLSVALKLSFVINAYLLAAIVPFIIAALLLKKSPGFHLGKAAPTTLVKEVYLYSIPLFITTIGFLVSAEIDTVMIGLFMTDGDVGKYAVAKKIAVKIPHLSIALSVGTMPVFAKLNRDNGTELKRVLLRTLKYNTYILAIVVIGIIFTGWFLIPAVYGDYYRDAVPTLNILSLYTVCFSTSIILEGVLDYQGRAKKRARNMVISILVNIALNYALIPRYGIEGAAMASSISVVPLVLLNGLEVKKVFGSVGA